MRKSASAFFHAFTIPVCACLRLRRIATSFLPYTPPAQIGRC